MPNMTEMKRAARLTKRSVDAAVGGEAGLADTGQERSMSLVVLGIDAAWTSTNPSGLALAVQEGGRWRLVTTAASYLDYQGAAGETPVDSHTPDVSALIEATERLCGRPPSLVAVDMPLSRTPITMRRVSDNAVSRAYGGRHCATHTPSAQRPGQISDRLTQDFASAGYRLGTDGITGRNLIEVYPHPALVELAQESRRLPYKVSKIGAYWPELPPLERRENLLAVWRRIVVLLDQEIEGVADRLRPPDLAASIRDLKAFEDRLDAVVCAWVGVCVLDGRAKPFGDETSAIWIPSSRPMVLEPA